VKTTLDLPDQLVQQLKIRAVQERRPIKRLVAELLSQSLNAASAPHLPAAPPLPKNIVMNERGFPVIRCGQDVPASQMTVEELVAMEQEVLFQEDMQRAGIPR
jgi:plasmid stability protein